MQPILEWFVHATLQDFLGVTGVLGYVSAYFLLQIGIFKPSGYAFSIMNLVASGCILASLSQDFNAYSAATEIAWSLISILGIARVFYIHTFVRFSPSEARALSILAPGLAKNDARRLLAIGHRAEIPMGTALVHEGQKIDNLFVLLDGRCRVRKDEVDVATLGAGAIVGEMTYANGMPATATVETLENIDVYVFAAEKLRKLLSANPGIASELELASASVMRQRLKDTTDSIARMVR